jgi:ubiquinone/menaquinone biosynthesis C-methylase UbiE
MKKISNIEYYNIREIVKKLEKKITEDEIGAIDSYTELYLNENYCTFGPLNINLKGIKIPGRILDIGGGGEGVIGQFKRNKVIAIDPSKRELEEAPKNDALNIVMDAKDMKFIDNTFDSVTSFFTLMYIPLSDHRVIFQEIQRVLKHNGQFFLWDINLPRRTNPEKEIYIITLKITIDDKVIDAGYGTRWEKEQNANYFIQLGREVGFEVLEQKVDDYMFYIKFKKV